jgi:ketosteroid isomerase-like protein
VSPESYALHKDAARANRSFYAAVQHLDLDAMRIVWLDDPTIKCVHPGGELIIGSERVMESFRLIFEHSKSLRFEILDSELNVSGELAWANHVERMHIELESGIAVTEAAATNLFVRRDEEWKMVLHHSSPIARRFFDE